MPNGHSLRTLTTRPGARHRVSTLGRDARRHRRPPRLHAAVRLRAGRRPRTAGRDVRLLTSRFRFGAVPAADGFAVDDSLYRLSSRIERAAPALAVKALEHPLRPRTARSLRLRRPPPAVGRSARGRRAAAPHAPPTRLHRPRPAPAPNGPPHENVEAPLRPLRPRRHAQRARPQDARGIRRARSEAAGDPPPRLPQRSRPARRRPHRARARRDPALQGASRRDRGRRDASPARGCSSRATRASRSTACGSRRATGPSGGSAIWATPRSRTRSARPPSPSSRTGPSSTSPGRCCR